MTSPNYAESSTSRVEPRGAGRSEEQSAAPSQAAKARSTGRQYLILFVEIGIVAIIYAITSRLGILLAIPPGYATPVFPAAGVGLAAILLRGFHVSAGIWIGSFIATSIHSLSMENLFRSLLVTSSIGAGAALQAVASAYLLRYFTATDHAAKLLDSGRNVLSLLLFGGVTGCTVSATFGVTTLAGFGLLPWANYAESWQTWWLGDAAGSMIVAPMLLAWSYRATSHPARAFFAIEAILLAVLIVGVGVAAFGSNLPVEYLVIPLLVWAAFRFGAVGATSAIILTTAAAVWGTIHGHGPFIGRTTNASLLLLQAFLGSVTICTLVLTGVLAERKNAQNALRQANDDLEKKVQERTSELNRVLASLWSEIDLAHKLQTVLLPSAPQLSGYEVAAKMQPAEMVGGDYYDVLADARNTGWVLIGDVSGHGVSAGLLMMMITSAVRTALLAPPQGENSLTPAKLLTQVNSAIYDSIEQVGRGQYMTVSALKFENGRISHAGLHLDILVYRAKTQKVEQIRTDGVWLGVLPAIEAELSDAYFEVDPGDTILLFTDGVTEARVETKMLGVDWLAQTFGRCAMRGQAPQAIIDDLLTELGSSAQCTDDMTLVALRRIAQA